MNTKQRERLYSALTLGYVALVSIAILITALSLTGSVRKPSLSPVPVLDTASLKQAQKLLGERDAPSTPSASPAVQFGKAEPFK